MLAAYAFWAFNTGELGFHLSTPLACLVALVVVLALAMLSEFAVFRPLRTASPLAKLVATLGLLLAAQAAMLLAFGFYPQAEPAILPHTAVVISHNPVPVDRFIITGLVLLASVCVAAMYKWTLFGLSTRAAAENTASALAIGLSPNALSMVNTMIAYVIAGTLGVVAAPLITLDSQTLPLVIMPALAAALFARFSSCLVATLAGLGIGMLENLLYYASTQSWFPTSNDVAIPGAQEVLVFVLIVIAVLWRGASLPLRGDIVERALPPVPSPERIGRVAAIALAAGTIALIVLPFDFRQALTTSIIGTVLVLSLVVIAGFVGQVSVMQLALSGVAGLVMSHLAAKAGIVFPLAPLIGALAATAIGLIVAVPALRIRGVQLAVVTLAAAVAFEQFWFINGTWGAGQGGAYVPQPHVFGIDLGNDAGFRGLDGKLPSPILGIIILIVAVAAGSFVANLRRSWLGQQMLAVRANERAAASMGISVRNIKICGLALSAFIAGLAGAMYAYNFGSVSATRFGALTALSVIAFAYIGGITMISGAVIAGFLATTGLSQHALEKWFGLSGTWTLLFAGVALIGNVVFYPDGVAGTGYKKRQYKRNVSLAGEPARRGIPDRLRPAPARPGQNTTSEES
jgi:branched-chain amino acid transport system permease protein